MIWVKRILGTAFISVLAGLPFQAVTHHAIGGLMGPAIVLLIASVWYLFSAQVGVWMLKAQPVTDGWLRHAAVEYARRMGLSRPPGLYYVESPVANAYAFGRPGAGAVVLTSTLLRELHSAQLIGVLGHEFHHIRARDTLFVIFGVVAGWILRIATWCLAAIAAAYTLALFVVSIAGALVGAPVRVGDLGLSQVARGIGGVGLRINQMLTAFMSREAELLADRAGAQLAAEVLGVPEALGARYMASALRAIEHINGNQPPRGTLAALIAPHPPLEVRLSNLERMEGGKRR